MSGLQRRHHAQALRHAQDLWDLGCRQDALAELEAVLPRLRPRTVATDAVIVATLATYCAEMGDPRRGLSLLSHIPLDGTRPTDVHLICLGARSVCRASTGDFEGARHDRATILDCDPCHPALVLANVALGAVHDAEESAQPG